jgi:large conductance mechanosensitive channel
MLKEFRDFLLRGNLVELAVAVVIGTAFATLVSAFTQGLITPLIAAVGSEPDFSALSFTVNGSRFRYGLFINALVSFLIVTSVIFFFVIKPLSTVTARKKAGLAAGEETRACPECLSEVPARARRCAFCTVEIDAAA